MIPWLIVPIALVERIAISIWHQRRLVSAETAALGLSRQPLQIASALTAELKRGYGSEVKEGDLQHVDQERIAWCQAVLCEVEKLEHIDPASLPKMAPTVFEQLQSDAEEEGEGVETFLASHKDGLTGFVGELVTWCHQQLEGAKQHPKLLELAEAVKQTRAVLPHDALDVLSRYQTTLDNQMTKALRALREAQEWRLKTLDAEQPPRQKPATIVA